jgi:UDP:flavonoid glycosyltransferase YjiC (YdhE family)
VGPDHPILNSSPKSIQYDYLPYDWIFSRSAAVIHHGGAGTTGIALKAGVPNIVLPFTSDQPFWGQRVYKLGAGPKPINIRHLTDNKLTQALKHALHKKEMKERAQYLSAQIQQENGVEKAVKTIEETLENYSR